jgi:hypothetical protein
MLVWKSLKIMDDDGNSGSDEKNLEISYQKGEAVTKYQIEAPVKAMHATQATTYLRR